MAAPKTSKGQTPRVLKRREWWKQRQVDDGTADCPGEEMGAESMEHIDPKQSRADGSEASGLRKNKSNLGIAPVSKPTVKRRAASVDENEGAGFTKKKKKVTEACDDTAVFSNEQEEEEEQEEEVHEKHPAKGKKHGEKKNSREKNANADVSPDEWQLPADSSSKKKKPKKAPGALTENADSQTSCSSALRQHRQQEEEEEGHETQMHTARSNGGQKVYCVFVGNLPYDVTKEQLSEHFSVAGNIKAIRIPTAKDTGKPRGFAYIEFKDKHSHRLGLGLHHTELGNRVINVEFTSAGGRCEKRLEHLRQKNQALERFKRLPWS